jgi:long-chain fatty acid transport protein
MKRILFLMMFLVLGTTLLMGQSVNRGAFSILGAGARAMGMGGAFTAIADDATAASWNPAGLAQLTKPEASLVYDTYTSDVSFKDQGQDVFAAGYSFQYEDQNDKADLDYKALSFASFLYPFEVAGRNLVTQFSYSRVSNFPDVDNSFTYHYEWASGGEPWYTADDHRAIKTTFDGGINAYTLSVASNIATNFHLGISLNYLKADTTVTNDIYQAYQNSEGENYTDSWRERMQYEFNDLYFDFGFLWRINDMFSVGGVYHSGFTTEADYDFYGDKVKGDLTWPSGWGVGVSFRPIQPLTLALDYSERSWSDATLKWQGTPPDYLDNPTYFPYVNFDRQFDTTSIRFGVEYALVLGNNAVIPFRAGYFKEDEIASYFVDAEQPSSTGYTLGTGYTYKNFQVDVAYIHTKADTEQLQGEWTGWDPDFGDYTSHYFGSFESTTDRLMLSAIVRF